MMMKDKEQRTIDGLQLATNGNVTTDATYGLWPTIDDNLKI